MKLITTKVHGVVDYVMGGFLIVAPWLFGFARGGAETWVPVVLGTSTLVYSLLTRYELGVWPTISMRSHLTLDLMSGILLALSPWIFGFSEYVYLPHLILGILEVGATLMTQSQPAYVGVKATSDEHHRHAH